MKKFIPALPKFIKDSLQQKNDPDIISKFLCEVRYVPNPLLLDKRGEIVGSFATDYLAHWKIDKNRVDVYNEELTEGIFAGFKNAGFTTTSSNRIHYLTGQLESYLTKYFTILVPERIGSRSTYLFPSQKSFKTLVADFQQKVVKMDAKILKSIEAKLVDVGSNLIFEKGNSKFNVSMGPMKKWQSSKIFSQEDLPKIGFYIDIDCYTDKLGKQSKSSSVASSIRRGFTENDEMFKAFKEITE